MSNYKRSLERPVLGQRRRIEFTKLDSEGHGSGPGSSPLVTPAKKRQARGPRQWADLCGSDDEATWERLPVLDKPVMVTPTRPSPFKRPVDKTIIERRQKDIDYGKNTMGYQNYVELVPKEKREKSDPRTPEKFIKYSRRSWDQQVKLWRLKLHAYDPNDGENDAELDMSDFMSDISFSSKLASTPGCSSPISSAQCSSPFLSPMDDDYPPLPSSELDNFTSEPDENCCDGYEMALFADMKEDEFVN